MSIDHDLARVARIGDSVFAVTVTLLAYRVRIPDAQALDAGTLKPLLPFLGDLGAVLMSSLIASLFWISHWRVMRRLQHCDIGFVALNFFFYAALVLLPISTSLLNAQVMTTVGALGYSVNLFLLALASMLLRRRARLLDPQAFGPGLLLLSPTIVMALFGAAAVVSLYRPTLAPMFWSAALLTPWIDRRWGMGASERGGSKP